MTYSATYFTTRESWRDWRIEARELIQLARVAPGARVLEIGCGGGGLLRMLRARGADAVGVDTLDTALNLARESSLRAERSNPHRTWKIASSPNAARLLAMTLVRIGQDTTLPFATASFDAIIGQHVVEHLPDIDAALDEWKRLLKPQGCLALATPNALYPDPAHFADADHAHIFTLVELRHAFKRAGFVVENSATIFPYLARARLLQAIGVMGYRMFQRIPYFSSHGRTLLISGHLL